MANKMIPLVERLRDDRRRYPFEPWARRTMLEAADRIEELQKALGRALDIAENK